MTQHDDEHEVLHEALENLLHETRVFPPPTRLAASANATADWYTAAETDRLSFWETQARRLTWERQWDQVLDWTDAPVSRWFVGGQLNVAVNCVDRHVAAGHGDRVAFHFEGEPGDMRTLTYRQMQDAVCQAANALVELGVNAGDRVASTCR